MNIADSTSFTFQFSERPSDQTLGSIKLRIFDNSANLSNESIINPAVVNWRVNDRSSLARRAFAGRYYLKTFQANNVVQILPKCYPWGNFFSLNTATELNIPNDRKISNLANTNTLKCFLSDDPARRFLNDEFQIILRQSFNFCPHQNDELWTENRIKWRLTIKSWIFVGLSLTKNSVKTQLTS